jgi:aminoglycoside phosphotransferase (APT) family kinase protein
VSPSESGIPQKITRIILDEGLLTGDFSVSYLAAGEYNANYTVTKGGERYVFRINYGSQLGLKNQIEYEYSVLDALKESGVTPRPYWYSLDSGGLGDGVMLMEYLPGSSLEYQTQWRYAAAVFAEIHRTALPAEEGPARLIIQKEPISDIAAESLGLIRRFPDHPLSAEKNLLLTYHDRIVNLAEMYETEFSRGYQCIVNTEVNSGNFLIDEPDAYLVDWEKGVVSSPFQDLGHFLVETSTRWKGGYVFSEEEKEDFLKEYLARSVLDMDLETARGMTGIMEKTILLRALSWCYMAWYEYNCTDRNLSGSGTAGVINRYLQEIEWFLR